MNLKHTKQNTPREQQLNLEHPTPPMLSSSWVSSLCDNEKSHHYDFSRGSLLFSSIKTTPQCALLFWLLLLAAMSCENADIISPLISEFPVQHTHSHRRSDCNLLVYVHPWCLQTSMWHPQPLCSTQPFPQSLLPAQYIPTHGTGGSSLQMGLTLARQTFAKQFSFPDERHSAVLFPHTCLQSPR